MIKWTIEEFLSVTTYSLYTTAKVFHFRLGYTSSYIPMDVNKFHRHFRKIKEKIRWKNHIPDSHLAFQEQLACAQDLSSIAKAMSGHPKEQLDWYWTMAEGTHGGSLHKAKDREW